MLHSPEHPETTLVASRPNHMAVYQQADSDTQLIELWLHGRSRHTISAYRADVQRFMNAVAKALHQITLSDLQKFASALGTTVLKPASQHRVLSSIKSLFAFGHRLGYLPLDVARPLRLPSFRDGLADRILDESQVQRMLTLEAHPRNHAILMLLYAAGLRVSELCGLRWQDVQARGEAGQVTVFGKRGKTRTILLPISVFHQLVTLRNGGVADTPVFRSRKRGHLTPAQVWRIVRRAAQRAGIERSVSCHWMRHAHASHSLDRGAPISLVQGTLGHASIATTGRYLHARPHESSSTYLPL